MLHVLEQTAAASIQTLTEVLGSNLGQLYCGHMTQISPIVFMALHCLASALSLTSESAVSLLGELLFLVKIKSKEHL